VVAVGSVITPVAADPPVPTFTVKDAVPLLLEIEGFVPNPEAIVGAVDDRRTWPPFGTMFANGTAVDSTGMPVAPVDITALFTGEMYPVTPAEL
jgi:hypothetical protein